MRASLHRCGARVNTELHRAACVCTARMLMLFRMEPTTTNPKKGLRFSITVFPALRDAIEKAAKADGRKKSDWIERALAKVLKVKEET